MTAHLYADERIVHWLTKSGYHPRSDKHGEAICSYFLQDLLYSSSLLREGAKKGVVVYETDYVVGRGALRWNIDLVLGSPISKPLLVTPERRISRGELREIWLAIDAKSVMTEHGKARRNRQRDLNSLADIVKHYYPSSVVGGIVMVNVANRFRSPLRDDITEHRNIRRLVKETIEIFKQIPRADVEGGTGIEAVGIIVVNHTNIPSDQTRLVTAPPAPQVGDVCHYQKSLRLIREALEQRFLAS